MKNDWFTVEALDADTYAISEYQHWEQTHCYLLCGTQRAVLIDSGLGVGDIKAVVDSLTSLPVTVLTTHAHWDHIGGHRLFDAFAVHPAERAWLAGAFPLPLQVVKQNLLREPCAFPAGFDPDTYQLFQGEPQFLLHDGAVIELGGRTLQVLHTPGHSPGHCCFYEAARQTLYAGDLLYLGCLDMFYPTTDPQQFYRSVQKVRALPAEHIRPGHHSLAVPAGFASRVEAAFAALERAGTLRQGGGIVSFGDFQLHL